MKVGLEEMPMMSQKMTVMVLLAGLFTAAAVFGAFELSADDRPAIKSPSPIKPLPPAKPLKPLEPRKPQEPAKPRAAGKAPAADAAPLGGSMPDEAMRLVIQARRS